MARGQSISFRFPPFAGWVRRIVLACTGIYLFQAVMGVFAPAVVILMREWLALIPVAVMHGRVWQLVTYSLLHAGFGHVFFNMLTLWFIGAYLESDWGPRRFIECYTFCVVGAALTTIVIAYTHFLGSNPAVATVGASGGIFGLLMAFGILYADQEMYLFPLPFRIKAKYLVGIWVVVAIIAVFEPSQGGV
ncbi:MAG: rhomboid family intramembrane serine protease, partial [Terriglobales bacterium]